MSVAQMGAAMAEPALPNLLKVLREGLVNRQTVAETIINLGVKGEQALLHVLKEDMKSNLKFRECLVRSLAMADLNSPNIDFVVEALFDTARDANPKVRKSSLFSLDILHQKA